MAIESIGAVGSAASPSGAASLGQDDFLKILLTQLSFQDPLKPMDNQEFIAQMAQFSSLEQTRQLNERVDSLLQIQATTQTIGLVGRTVEVRSETGFAVGRVVAAAFPNGTPSLTIRTATGEFLTDISLSQIYSVQ